MDRISEIINNLRSTVTDFVQSRGVTTYVLTSSTVLLTSYLGWRCYTGPTWKGLGVKQISRENLDIMEECKRVLQGDCDSAGFISDGHHHLLTRDLDLLRHILVRDFANFSAREEDYMMSNCAFIRGVFFLKGDEWKNVRNIMTPFFSNTQLRPLSSHVSQTAEKLANFLEDCAKKNQLVGIKHTCSQYSSSIIARLILGAALDNRIGDEDDEFTYYAKNMIKMLKGIDLIFAYVLYKFLWLGNFLVRTLGISYFDLANPRADIYFKSTLRPIITQRRHKKSSQQNDVLQALIHNMASDAQSPSSGDGADVTRKSAMLLTEEDVIGQMVFLTFAGFETTATTLQMCLMCLAQNPDVQDRVYEEIQTVVKTEIPTNEELAQMTYTLQVLKETMRLYPPLGIMGRQAAKTKSYGTVTIPQGTRIFFPIFCIHRNPKVFPDPDKFDPQRFSDEAKAKLHPMAFMPFGLGPRQCLGMRLAYIELQMALVHILRKVKVEVNEETMPKIGEELKLSYQDIIVLEKAIMLAFKPRQT